MEVVLRVLEFYSRLALDDTLTVPSDIAQQIQAGQTLCVMLLIPETSEDQTWAKLTTAQFCSGYTDGDAIYDSFSPCPI